MAIGLEYLRELNIHSLLLRIFCAMLAGGIIGFERERKGRPAGFRTYMLVSLGAAMTVLLGQYMQYMSFGPWSTVTEAMGIKTDTLRFGAQVINGVGFLGAGTIIVTKRQETKGLTTAAGLWASACMGIAIGAGFYELMLICLVLMIFSMKVLPSVENIILSKSRNFNIYVQMDNIQSMGVLMYMIKSEGIAIFSVDIDKEEHQRMSQVNAQLSLRLPGKQQHTEVLAYLSRVEGLISIEEL